MTLETEYRKYLERYGLKHSPEERLAFAMVADHILKMPHIELRQECIDVIIEETGAYIP